MDDVAMDKIFPELLKIFFGFPLSNIISSLFLTHYHHPRIGA
jgi:hypothetical protein